MAAAPPNPYARAFSQLGWNNDRAAFPYFHRFHVIIESVGGTKSIVEPSAVRTESSRRLAGQRSDSSVHEAREICDQLLRASDHAFAGNGVQRSRLGGVRDVWNNIQPDLLAMIPMGSTC